MLVAALRQQWGAAGEVPNAVGFAQRAWVEPSRALILFAISAISLFVGASLGPSFGIIVSAGGVGSWLANRSGTDDVEGKHEYALTGMAGGLGAVFSGPMFASVMASELSPTPKERYVAAFIPQLVAATIGYVIFFGIKGCVMLDAFGIPGYQYENRHLMYGLVLGIFAVVVLMLQALIGNGLRRVVPRVKNRCARAAVGGASVGLIAYALPLTATGGSSQLAFETSNISSLGVGLLAAVPIGKIAAFVLSEEAGFLGGPVFPVLFIGGTAELLVHAWFPQIPAPLCVAAMVAALPGATLAAPMSFIVLGVGVVGVGIPGIAPVGIAVIAAHVAVWGLDAWRPTLV